MHSPGINPSNNRKANIARSKKELEAGIRGILEKFLMEMITDRTRLEIASLVTCYMDT